MFKIFLKLLFFPKASFGQPSLATLFGKSFFSPTPLPERYFSKKISHAQPFLYILKIFWKTFKSKNFSQTPFS
jgi:hypothetical protein